MRYKQTDQKTKSDLINLSTFMTHLFKMGNCASLTCPCMENALSMAFKRLQGVWKCCGTLSKQMNPLYSHIYHTSQWGHYMLTKRCQSPIHFVWTFMNTLAILKCCHSSIFNHNSGKSYRVWLHPFLLLHLSHQFQYLMQHAPCSLTWNTCWEGPQRNWSHNYFEWSVHEQAYPQ